MVALLKSQHFVSFIGIQIYDLSWLLALVSFIVFILDHFFLDPVQQEQKAMAAAIQEEFDCDVLQIHWNDIELPKRPERDETISNSECYLDRYGSKKLYNWYACSDNDLIPLAAARAICQRSNVSWDSKLRKRYINLILFCGILISVSILLVSIAYDLSLRGLISTVIFPLLPVANFIAGEIRQNRSAIQVLEEIRDCIEEQWDLIINCDLSDSELANKSRQLQDRIYASRKRSTLIPDWLYEKLRPSSEALMVKTGRANETTIFGSKRA